MTPVSNRLPTCFLLALAVTACNGEDGSKGMFGSSSASDTDNGTDDTSATASSSDSGPTGGSGGSTSDSSSDSASTTGDSATSGGPKLDVGMMPDLGGCDGGGGGGMLDFSNIWIANSAEGTVSKIDTFSATEIARYRTRQEGSVSALTGPSRTSVNLHGDMVVVNRDGHGAVKIAARESDCVDRNANGMIDTSSGATDIMDWAGDWPPADECILWKRVLPSASRPAAWTSGNAMETECGTVYQDMKVWTAAPDPQAPGGAIVYLLDGDTGDVEDFVEIAPADCNCTTFGLYGAAVDEDDNAWMVAQSGAAVPNEWGFGPLIFIDHGTLDYTVHPFPANARAGYGVMVDSENRPWVAGFNGDLYRYDPGNTGWTKVDISGLPSPFNGASSTLRGIQQDATGDIWVALALGYPTQIGATTHGLLRVDGANATVKEIIDSNTLTGLSLPAGISIDVEGYVWIVDTTGNQAFKVDPADSSFDTVQGLVNPYTYSDMTGFGLQNVQPPAG